MPSYTQAKLSTSVASKVSGEYSAADFLIVANNAVRTLMSEVDLRSSIRKTNLSPNLFDDVYEYTLPSTIKGNKIIDIQPQIGRGKYDDWTLVAREEFDRLKSEGWLGESIISIDRDDLVNKLLISRPIDDTEAVISTFDSLTAGGGTWEVYSTGSTNITKDADNYVKGSASLNWDISSTAAQTTAGIKNDDVDDFDVSDYKSNGSAFVWVYISSATNLTNFILKVGSSSSAYYSITITTNNEGASFYTGWNLLRFDFSGKSTTGTPDDDNCDYVALYMTKDTDKTSETDYRFDNLVLKLGDHYNVIYYSRYFWQSSAGTYLEDATAVTDLLNCETDEYPLFITKCAALIEEFLKNYSAADRLEAQYERMKREYIFTNPSQALLLQNTYWNM